MKESISHYSLNGCPMIVFYKFKFSGKIAAYQLLVGAHTLVRVVGRASVPVKGGSTHFCSA